MNNRKSIPTKSRSNAKSIESNLEAVPKIDIAEKEKKPSMNFRIIWSKIRDYFGKADETEIVPIVTDDASIQKEIEEIKDNRFFVELQREFKKIPKRERKQIKLQFLKYIQEAQPTKYESHKDKGYFTDLMSCIKQEVLLF
ncbi:uncharacterized protein LOC114129482 [Aphis gossypii]|uniref:Uncharacterized protein n=1 Tax=Aphis gossypii TaxID=80765 RepID=A0A9P0J650_APHGO|nr:uncharacterized protein LOC114129482 [Aphis gossypii]CAH1731003.1 unnamed protein product [Aphis gossypii]